MCVLSIKVPIRKKSGNLFNDPRIYIYIYMIWHWLTYKGWYAIKHNQTKPSQSKPKNSLDLIQGRKDGAPIYGRTPYARHLFETRQYTIWDIIREKIQVFAKNWLKQKNQKKVCQIRIGRTQFIVKELIGEDSLAEFVRFLAGRVGKNVGKCNCKDSSKGKEALCLFIAINNKSQQWNCPWNAYMCFKLILKRWFRKYSLLLSISYHPCMTEIL